MALRANEEEVYRRTAEIIDKVLKSANPTDVPIARPTKFELFITLTTEKALGLTSHNHSCCAPKKCRVGLLCGMFVQYRTNFASRLLTGYDALCSVANGSYPATSTALEHAVGKELATGNTAHCQWTRCAGG